MRERFSVFATVGNATQPFDRFVRLVDGAAAATGLATLIQVGRSSCRPEHARAVEFVGRPEFEQLIREADFVVTHGGSGSMMTAIRLGKQPIVVVRRSCFREVIDDHQQDLAGEFSRAGLVRLAESVDDLVAHLQEGPSPLPASAGFSNTRMLNIVERFLFERI